MGSARVVVGAGLALLSVFFLFGGFFVPLAELMRDPGLIPMPERLLGIWGVFVGVLLMVLPLRGSGV